MDKFDFIASPPPLIGGKISDCTFVGVAWNEAARAPLLLEMARQWFPAIVVGVQESTDGTLSIAKSIADRSNDQVVEHPHYGYGDKSFPDLISRVWTRWTMVVSFDEMPSQELLESIPTAIDYAEMNRYDGVWIPFRSLIEGIEYEEQHGHLRLFESRLGWPRTLHSRPRGKREVWWPYGYILHERSLDEMVQDYLRYYELGKGNTGWEKHNLMMMREACKSVATKYGWPYVQEYAWWPKVLKMAFGGDDPSD